MVHPEVDKILAVLKSGETLLYPTDTIWGVGCDALNSFAIQKVKQLKRRDPNKSFIVLCSDIEQLKVYVPTVPKQLVEMHLFSERPLTIIYPRVVGIGADVLAADGSLGIRIPTFSFCRQMIQLYGKPIVSTSANLTGMPAPLNFSDIAKEIVEGVDYVVQDFHSYSTPYSGSKIIKLQEDGSLITIRE